MYAKYVKRPIVIEAVKWTGKNLQELTEFIEGKAVLLNVDIARDKWYEYSLYIEQYGLYIETLEGKMKASIGDYIIKGVNGEFYPCKPDIFHLTYDTWEE